MKTWIFFALCLSLATSFPTENETEELGIEERHHDHEHEHHKEELDVEDADAARNARFNFGYSIQDDINGAVVQRTEERDGLTLTGEYTYSDGFFKRTVAYEADENGYRVTKMISEPIGNGPVMNKMGRAIVQMLVSGVQTEYAIQAQPMEDIEEDIAQDPLVNEGEAPAESLL